MSDDNQFEEQNDGLEPQSPKSNLNKNQKIAAASLAVFAVLIVVLWSVQLKNSIYGPFNSNVSNSGIEQTSAADQTANDLALKNKDTDADGLSDYDELNLYKTSPYLEDSDGDGLKDGEEIKKGADPNCPAGRTCASSGLNENSAGAASGTPASSTDILNNLSKQSAGLNGLLNQYNAANPAAGSAAAGSGAGSLTPEQKQALKGIDAASLRQMLLTAGMPKEALDQISDTELMKSYGETLNSQ